MTRRIAAVDAAPVPSSASVSAVKRLVPRPLRRLVRRLWPSKPRPLWDRLRLLGLPTPVSPTPAFKHRVIKGYSSGIDAFVETGTYRGDTVEAMRRQFRAVWSIELAHDLAVDAQRRFVAWPHVTILEGDSAAVLPELVGGITYPCLFWLDGHWCGGETARAETETPLRAELQTVLARTEPDVILIDDARLLGTRGYPTVETVARLAGQAVPRRTLQISHDIARIVPSDDDAIGT
jgi:hypothetical protein